MSLFYLFVTEVNVKSVVIIMVQGTLPRKTMLPSNVKSNLASTPKNQVKKSCCYTNEQASQFNKLNFLLNVLNVGA